MRHDISILIIGLFVVLTTASIVAAILSARARQARWLSFRPAVYTNLPGPELRPHLRVEPTLTLNSLDLEPHRRLAAWQSSWII